MNSSITAVILTHDDVESIKKCINSVLWCNKIVIIDDFSTSDFLYETKKQEKVEVLQRLLDGDYASQRNFGLEHVDTDWALFVDADEEISEDLRDEIQLAIKTKKNNAYFIPRRDHIWGSQLNYGENLLFSIIRLARKNAGAWRGRVHETWNIKEKVGRLKKPIFHFPHATINEFIQEVDTYSTIRAKELYSNKLSASFLGILGYTLGKFFLIYVYKLGFLDGVPGLISAISMSFYTFLTRSKLWMYNNKKTNAQNFF